MAQPRRITVPAVPTNSKLVDEQGNVTAEYAHFLRELADQSKRISDLESLVCLKPQAPGRLAQLAIDADITPQKDADVSLGSLALRFLDLFVSGFAQLANVSYVSGSASSTAVSFGAVFQGVSWVAKYPNASIVEMSSTTFRVYYDAGLTVDAIYTPTMVFQVDLATGDITATRDVAIARDLAITRNAAVTGNLTVTGNAAVTGDLNVAGNYKTGGTPGESVTLTYLTGTAGAGQSSKTVTFTKGLETAHTP